VGGAVLVEEWFSLVSMKNFGMRNSMMPIQSRDTLRDVIRHKLHVQHQFSCVQDKNVQFFFQLLVVVVLLCHKRSIVHLDEQSWKNSGVIDYN
jgi:hypothetical protein